MNKGERYDCSKLSFVGLSASMRLKKGCSKITLGLATKGIYFRTKSDSKGTCCNR